MSLLPRCTFSHPSTTGGKGMGRFLKGEMSDCFVHEIWKPIISPIHVYLMKCMYLHIYILYNTAWSMLDMLHPTVPLFSSTEGLNKLRRWIEVSRFFFVDTMEEENLLNSGWLLIFWCVVSLTCQTIREMMEKTPRNEKLNMNIPSLKLTHPLKIDPWNLGDSYWKP